MPRPGFDLIWRVTFDQIDVVILRIIATSCSGRCRECLMMAWQWGLWSQDTVVGIDITSAIIITIITNCRLTRLPQPQPTPSPTVPLSVVRINNKCLISSPAPHRNIKPSPIITPSALWNNGSRSRQRHRATSYTPSLANDLLWENSDSWKARAG